MSPRTLNDLALFSPWPARLLGLDPWVTRPRTPEAMDTEFEIEKWGGLLGAAHASESKFDLEAADTWARGISRVLYSDDEELIEASTSDAHAKYRDLVARTVGRYVPAAAVAELGAGYGSIILDLARRPEFALTMFIALELTESGTQLISELSATEGLTVQTGRCDLTARPVTAIPIPEGAVIYTSYAAQYVPRLAADFTEGLAALAPSVVIHIEPCYEHCDGKTLLGLMRRRYIEVNDYNTNLVTVLHDQRHRGAIEILEERPAVFGSNPLLAASVIAWRPLLHE